jgi:two-component system, NtrC family, sensor kinase
MSLGTVSVIGQKCKRCFSCIRECPAIAIRVVDGQAVVLEERCISCGHCVKVCSQNAKEVQSDIENVMIDILPMGNAIAMIAPSFPASFPDEYTKLPTALREVGFTMITEAAFGADLVNQLYTECFEDSSEKTIISSPCPAVYNYIEKYFEELVPNLAKVVSPMIAMGRYLKQNFGEDRKVVFIGPCIAKKSEYVDPEVANAVDAVLTFNELKQIFRGLKVNLDELPESDFDGPHAYLGKSYPLVGGLLKTANINEDVLLKDIIVVEGKSKVIEIVEEIAQGKLKSKFVDILFCEGCINGPAIGSDLNYYSRREKVITYINDNINSFDKREWQGTIYNSRNINLKREFHSKPQRKPMPIEDEIKEILARSNKFSKSDELNCGSCGFPTCREYAVAIAKGLAEDDMCLPFLIEKLEVANIEIRETHEQLHSAEKLASIGQLAAGVAHEINNPLGSIMLYASMLKRKLEKAGCDPQNSEDIQMIMDEATRCKNIVGNLLNFARQGRLKVSVFDVFETIKSIVQTIMLNPDNSKIVFNVNSDERDCKIEGDNDQLKQVFINLLNNAVEALESQEIKQVAITIKRKDDFIAIEIVDTGCGIPADNVGKIFTPFFTTKKMGKGTGLGLAITYGIIKMHKGDIKVKSVIEKGTTFTIKLPSKLNVNAIMN